MWVEHGRGIGMDWEGLEWGCSNIELLSLVKGWKISLAYATQRALWTPSGRFHVHRAASIIPLAHMASGTLNEGPGGPLFRAPLPLKLTVLIAAQLGPCVWIWAFKCQISSNRLG